MNDHSSCGFALFIEEGKAGIGSDAVRGAQAEGYLAPIVTFFYSINHGLSLFGHELFNLSGEEKDIHEDRNNRYEKRSGQNPWRYVKVSFYERFEALAITRIIIINPY